MTPFFSNKKIVITGGAGFIGSHLVEQLVAHGARVVVLDNLVTGKMENLSSVANHIEFIQGDIRSKETCLTVLHNTFAVFHLAAQVSVPESFENPTKCYETNVTGTFNLLEAAVAHNVQRFVFSSSCAVYGDQTGPCSENLECSPLSPYAYSKWMGEQLCQQYSKLFKLPTIVLRYFNVFGPRQDPHGQYAGVIAKFTEHLKHNQPITIFGDGSQSRDFVPVLQIVNANLSLAQLAPELCTAAPINVATGESFSILQIFERLKKDFPEYNYPITFAPARGGDIHHSQADCKRLKFLLAQ